MVERQGAEMKHSWEPPGPGTWELDTAHFDPMVSRPVRDMVTTSMHDGLSVGTELAGAPLATMDARFVNGRMYVRMVPLVGGSRDLPTPPKPVLWLVTRLHPAFRRRAKRSVQAVDERYWMDEFARWEREWKPKLIATNRRLGSVDVAGLTDDHLASHLTAVWDHVVASATLHFRLHVSDLGPIGLLLLRATEIGLDESAVMAALTGASPATSAPAVAARAIAEELERHGLTATSLDQIRAVSDRAAELLDDYLSEFGHRISTGYDVRDRTLAELPDVVVTSIRRADTSTETASAAAARGDVAFNELVEQIPAGRRDEFAGLVEDARALYGLRDENGPLTSQWPLGVLRMALLESARRLIAAERLEMTEHVFDASIDETVALLRGGAAPSPTELAGRCEARRHGAELEPPTVLGRPPEQPPIDVLPGRMPDMMRAVLLLTDLLERADRGSGAVALTSGLTGTGVGDASYHGIARVVADADEAFERVEPGDIIVTRLTVPTFNSVLAMAGAVVTEGGGLLCHTAVIARELGIPAVVGVPGALTEIPDGSRIEVDPVAGTVTVLNA